MVKKKKPTQKSSASKSAPPSRSKTQKPAPKAAVAKSKATAAAPSKVAAPAKAAVKPAVAKPAVTKPVAAKAVAAPAKAVAKPAVLATPPKAAAKPMKTPVPTPPRTATVATPDRGAPRQSVPASAQRAMPAGAKPADARLTAPAPHAGAAPKPQAAAAKPTASAEPKKPVTTRHGFKTNELIVYPAHGVGKIIGIEEQEIAGISLELFVIEFEKDKMTLRVPTSKLESVGMRKLAEDDVMKKAMETLKGKARIKRTMWSRRAQEYEAKINSGDLVSIAEVVRDLYRSEAQPEQSYSERQLYEAALDRMARELAAVDRSDERGAMQRITELLAKSARGRRAAEDGETSAEIKAA